MDDVLKMFGIALTVGAVVLFFASRGVDAALESIVETQKVRVDAQKMRDAEQDEKLDTILFVLEQILEGKLTND